MERGKGRRQNGELRMEKRLQNRISNIEQGIANNERRLLGFARNDEMQIAALRTLGTSCVVRSLLFVSKNLGVEVRIEDFEFWM